MSRRSIAQAIQAIGRPVFTTRDIAALRGGSVSATSQGLRRMESKGLLRGVSRGVWCTPADPRFTRFSLVPYLAGGHQAYVSFLSALHLHGLIEQIPQTIYAATTGPTRLRQTPFGAFSLHRIDPNFFKGYDWHGAGSDFLVASPEKALVDSFYVSSRRGKRFTFFPEIDLGDGFDLDQAVDWIDQIRDPMIRSYSRERLVKLSVSGRSKRKGVGSTVDPVIESYKKDIDRASIRENLHRSVDERIRNLESLQRFSAELRRAGRTLRSSS